MQVLIGLVQSRTNHSLLDLPVSCKHGVQNVLTSVVVHLPQTYRRGKAYLRCAILERGSQVGNKQLRLAGAHRCHGRKTQVAIRILCRVTQQFLRGRKVA